MIHARCATNQKNFARHSQTVLRKTCASLASLEIASLIETQNSDFDLSGFDSISDGEYACMMYLAEEIVMTAINDNSSNVSFDCSEENSEGPDSDSTRYKLSSSNLSVSRE